MIQMIFLYLRGDSCTVYSSKQICNLYPFFTINTVILYG